MKVEVVVAMVNCLYNNPATIPSVAMPTIHHSMIYQRKTSSHHVPNRMTHLHRLYLSVRHTSRKPHSFTDGSASMICVESQGPEGLYWGPIRGVLLSGGCMINLREISAA